MLSQRDTPIIVHTYINAHNIAPNQWNIVSSYVNTVKLNVRGIKLYANIDNKSLLNDYSFRFTFIWRFVLFFSLVYLRGKIDMENGNLR